MEHREESSHVLLARNTTKELCIRKFCRPKTAIKVECYLFVNNKQLQENIRLFHNMNDYCFQLFNQPHFL